MAGFRSWGFTLIRGGMQEPAKSHGMDASARSTNEPTAGLDRFNVGGWLGNWSPLLLLPFMVHLEFLQSLPDAASQLMLIGATILGTTM